jgi:4'-phosphopantetheinyl transferase
MKVSKTRHWFSRKINHMLLTFLSIDDGRRDLREDEVHLWSAPLDGCCDDLPLTDEERLRAGRFKLERMRRQFIGSRGHLRRVLSRYLALQPCAIPIQVEPSGKPCLDPAVDGRLQFNVSHSEALAVYAVTRRGRVGVDVERWREIPNAEALVDRFFTRRERDLFNALPDDQRQAAFFRAWTRKEAALKAVGYGVQSLDRCDVTFRPDEPELVLRMGDDSLAADKWLLRSWQPAPDYMAAVAVQLTPG